VKPPQPPGKTWQNYRKTEKSRFVPNLPTEKCPAPLAFAPDLWDNPHNTKRRSTGPKW